MIEIVEQGFDDMYAAIAPLLPSHYLESARYRDIFKLNPNLDLYRKVADLGNFLGLVARVDGALAGYSVNFLQNNLHYWDTFYAKNDLIFVAEEHRSSGVGVRLLRATEEAARKRGAKLLIMHAKTGTALDQICPRLGYDDFEHLWSKVL